MQRTKYPAPGERTGGQDDYDYHKAVAGRGRQLKCRLISRGGLSCRICGAPTLPISGDMCSQCMRWAMAARYARRLAELVGEGR
ncbi:MAG: hypothetical protein ACREYC_21740 [Gammaproteobacteria bacterium]